MAARYTPIPTAERPHPPAPPFALFRSALTSYYQSQLDTLFHNPHTDPLGLAPHIRSLLKELYDDQRHTYGRAGRTSLSTYHTGPNALKNESWLLGHEAVVAVGSGGGSDNNDDDDDNDNGDDDLDDEREAINRIESEVLMRAGRIMDESCEVWWEERDLVRREYGLLRTWCRARDIERLEEAKRRGQF